MKTRQRPSRPVKAGEGDVKHPKVMVCTASQSLALILLAPGADTPGTLPGGSRTPGTDSPDAPALLGPVLPRGEGLRTLLGLGAPCPWSLSPPLGPVSREAERFVEEAGGYGLQSLALPSNSL